MTDQMPLNTFPAKTEADWRALVEKALKGAPFASLNTTTLDNIEIAPLYARSGADESVSISPHLPADRRSTKTTWDIRTLHTRNDPQNANADILADLMGGANSVCLQMEAPGQNGLTPTYDAIAAATEGTHLDMIHLGVAAGDQYIGAALAMMALWDERGVKQGQRRGAINADPLGHLARTGGLENKLYDTLRILAHFVATNHAEWPDVTLMLADGRPYHEAGASEAQELAAMLATFVSYLRLGDEDGIAPYKIVSKIGVALSADADIFLNIAKIRAARLLIARVAEACGAEMFAPNVPVWVQTSERMMSTMDEHTNMLRTTAAASAAILGGADAITVLPFNWPQGSEVDDKHGTARRMARNTQIILAEESHLGRVIDPAAGSWYLDNLTRQLADRAWKMFQTLEEQNGIEEALRTGKLQDDIARMADLRRKAIADGDAPLVGTSVFPPSDVTSAPAERYTASRPAASEGEQATQLEMLRLAEPYEAAAQGSPS